MTDLPISLEDIRAAARGLDGVTLRTPLIEDPDVNAELGGRLLLKAENLQRTGAFKIRGAYWRMANMTPQERARGAITYSSGNHALGVARAAQELGSSALIVMPEDAPPAKVEAVRKMGAELVFYDRDREDYNDVVARLIGETGRVQIPTSAHPQVLAGAGTVALELFDQAAARRAVPDMVLTPCGGGGCTASTAIVAHELAPAAQVYAVEPELFDDTKRSLAAGHPVANPTGIRTICDAIMTPKPNDFTFAVNHALLAGGLTVSDDEVRAAMRFAFTRYRLVVEPGAAVGLAAVLAGRVDIRGKVVATVITGGNIDPGRFCDLTGACS